MLRDAERNLKENHLKSISIMLAGALTVIVAACSGEQADSSEPSDAAVSVAPSAAESQAPSLEPSAEPSVDTSGGALPSGSAVAIPSFEMNGDPELAGRFPETVGGEPLEVSSFTGEMLQAMGGSDPTFDAFLESVGTEMSEVSIAFGGAQVGEEPVSVGAFRVPGASEDELESQFLAASGASGDLGGFDEATVGGKDVLAGEDPSGETEGTLYLYTNDDTLYFLAGAEEYVAEVLEALP